MAKLKLTVCTTSFGPTAMLVSGGNTPLRLPTPSKFCPKDGTSLVVTAALRCTSAVRGVTFGFITRGGLRSGSAFILWVLSFLDGLTPRNGGEVSCLTAVRTTGLSLAAERGADAAAWPACSCASAA